MGLVAKRSPPTCARRAELAGDPHPYLPTPTPHPHGSTRAPQVGVVELAGGDPAINTGGSHPQGCDGSFNGGLFSLGLFLGALATALWVFGGAAVQSWRSGLPAPAGALLGTAPLLGLVVLGALLGAGGGAMSMGWGLVTGGVLSLVGTRVYTVHRRGEGLTLGAVVGVVGGSSTRSRTNPMAATDQSSVASLASPPLTLSAPPPVPTFGGPAGDAEEPTASSV